MCEDMGSQVAAGHKDISSSKRCFCLDADHIQVMGFPLENCDLEIRFWPYSGRVGEFYLYKARRYTRL